MSVFTSKLARDLIPLVLWYEKFHTKLDWRCKDEDKDIVYIKRYEIKIKESWMRRIVWVGGRGYEGLRDNWMADLSVMSLLSYLKRISHGNQGKEGRGEERGGRVNGKGGTGRGRGRGRGIKGGWKQKHFIYRLSPQHAMYSLARLVAGRNPLGGGILWYRTDCFVRGCQFSCTSPASWPELELLNSLWGLGIEKE